MTTSWKVLAASAVFLLGVAAGGALVASMAARASRLYVQMMRLRLTSELDDQSRMAWKRGDLPSAAIHASCAVVDRVER